MGRWGGGELSYGAMCDVGEVAAEWRGFGMGCVVLVEVLRAGNGLWMVAEWCGDGVVWRWSGGE